MQTSNFVSLIDPPSPKGRLSDTCSFFFFCPWISESVFIWHKILGKNCFPPDIWRLYYLPVLMDTSCLIIVISWLFVDDMPFLSESVYNLLFVLYALKLQKDMQLCIFFISPFQFWSFLLAQMVKNLPACRRPGFDPCIGNISWRRAWQPTPVFLPGDSPWTEEPSSLPSVGSQRVGHDWASKHSISQF